MVSDREFRGHLASSLLKLIRGLDAWLLLFLALVGVAVAAAHHSAPPPAPAPAALFGHQATLCALAFSPDGRLVATADVDGVVDLMDWESGEEWAVPPCAHGSEPSLAFSPDGRLLAIMEWGSGIRLWDIAANRQRSSLNVRGLRSVAFAADGSLLAITSGHDREVTKWDWAHDRRETMLEGQLTQAVATAFSPDGHTLAAAFLDGTINLWHLSTGQRFATLHPPSKPSLVLAFSQDGSLLASAGRENSSVWLWETSRGESRGALHDCRSDITALAFTPDGTRMMLAGLDGILHLRELSTGVDRVAFAASDGPLRVLSVSPDGRTLAAGGTDRKLRLWDLARVLETPARPSE